MRLLRVRRRKLKSTKFKNKWAELQKLCAAQENWPLAVITADKLLDEALKKKRMKGKSMGERLVSAQRLISNNDAVWYAHNLAKKLKAEEEVKPSQAAVKKSLLGFGQALRDLGALPVEEKHGN